MRWPGQTPLWARGGVRAWCRGRAGGGRTINPRVLRSAPGRDELGAQVAQLRGTPLPSAWRPGCSSERCCAPGCPRVSVCRPGMARQGGQGALAIANLPPFSSSAVSVGCPGAPPRRWGCAAAQVRDTRGWSRGWFRAGWVPGPPGPNQPCPSLPSAQAAPRERRAGPGSPRRRR